MRGETRRTQREACCNVRFPIAHFTGTDLWWNADLCQKKPAMNRLHKRQKLYIYIYIKIHTGPLILWLSLFFTLQVAPDGWTPYTTRSVFRFPYYGLLKANSQYHAGPVSCRAAKGLDCVFPILFTQCGRVWFTHATPRPCHAAPMPRRAHATPRPCHAAPMPRRAHAAPCHATTFRS
jgi:hypothetical protein